MPENNQDRRIIKTKKNLGEALMRLLCKKNLNEITTSELCKEANVSRATFYNNFVTTSDVLAYQLKTFFLDDSGSIQSISDKNVISLNKAYLFYVTRVVHNIILKKDIVCKIMDFKRDTGEMTLALREFFYTTIMDIVMPYKSLIEENVPLELFCNYLALSDVGLVYYISNHLDDYSEEKLVNYIYHLSFEIYYDFIEKSSFELK